MTELLTIIDQRTALYRLLQGLYTYPLTRTQLEPLLGLASEDGRLEPGLRRLRECLRGIDDWGAALDGLNAAATRLWEGPGRAPAPPYASFYLNGGRLMGPETQAVRRTYLRWGLASFQMGQVPDDHIAFEFAFMAHLSAALAAALAHDDLGRGAALLEAQGAFLRDHLAPWCADFCAGMVTDGGDAFFEGLASLTQGMVAADGEWLAVAVELGATWRGADA